MNQKMWDELKKQISLKQMTAEQMKNEPLVLAYLKVEDIMHNMEIDRKNGKFTD